MPPPVVVPCETLDDSFKSLLQNQQYCDVIFMARGVCIPAHKVCLVAASAIFEEIFLNDWTYDPNLLSPHAIEKPTNGNHQNGGCNNNSGHSTRSGSSSRSNSFKRTRSTSKERTAAKMLSDTAKLLDHEEVETSSADNSEVEQSPEGPTQKGITLNHAAFRSIAFERVGDAFHPEDTILQTVVTLNDNISPAVLQYVLNYLYTGQYKSLIQGK